MTKQNNELGPLGHFGPIPLGSGYKSSTSIRRSYKYPFERLIELLNVDCESTDDVLAYCENYTLLPDGQDIDLANFESDMVQFVREEQLALRAIYNRFINDEIEDSDIELINEKIQHIHPVISFKPLKSYEVMNRQNHGTGNEYSGLESDTTVILRSWRGSSVSTLWIDLVLFMESNNVLGVCKCTRFFLKTRKDKIYCSAECKDKQKKRRKRLK